MEFLTGLATAGIALILMVYIVLLIKLKAPPEYGEKKEKSVSNVPGTVPEGYTVAIRNGHQPKQSSQKNEKNSQTTPYRARTINARNKIEEPKKNLDEEKEPKDGFNLRDEKSFEGCPYKFGYLQTVPRNTPIPNDCFGCDRIVECGALGNRR